MLFSNPAFFQKFCRDLLLGNTVILHKFSAQPVFFIFKKLIQRNHHICSGKIGCNVIRIGNADIGRCPCRNIGDHIIINIAIVGIKPQIYRNIGIDLFKIRNGFLIDLCLGLVGIILCPESDRIISVLLKALRHRKRFQSLRTVTSRKQYHAGRHSPKQSPFFPFDFHPLVPPLDTPVMILSLKIRNKTISGTEMITTAAIIAGIFSLPKPFSLIS